MRFFTSALAAASTMFATVSAQASACPIDQQFCMRVGVPQASASSGKGNLYFQMQALSSYTWAGVGTGTRMSGANMFIIYSDGSGNVTVSPRTASGHSQPRANSDVSITMLEGSGIDGGIMTANFLCSNCDGLMDITGQNSFIAAWQEGSPIDSSSASASISQHDDYTRFNLDLSQAQISSDANPYVQGSSSGSGGNSTNGSNGKTGGTSGGLTGGNSAGSVDKKKSTVNLVLLHGVIMTIAFAFMYPVGAILMPLVGKWLVHASWQMVAFVAMWAGFGVGYSKAQESDMLFKQPHTILGTVICIAMIIQPVIGFLHHRYYKKHQSRGVVSYAHIWYGRLIMFIGIINGGLGLKLANAPTSFTVAYAVIAAIVGIAYCASSYVGEMRRNRLQNKNYQPTYSPRTGTTEMYKPKRGQYSPVQAQFPTQGPQGTYAPPQGQYGPPRQNQSNNQYGSYR